MTARKVGLFTDDKGNLSFTRISSAFIMLAAIILAVYQIHKDFAVSVELVLGMLGIAFGGKVAQKHFESK